MTMDARSAKDWRIVSRWLAGAPVSSDFDLAAARLRKAAGASLALDSVPVLTWPLPIATPTDASKVSYHDRYEDFAMPGTLPVSRAAQGFNPEPARRAIAGLAGGDWLNDLPPHVAAYVGARLEEVERALHG